MKAHRPTERMLLALLGCVTLLLVVGHMRGWLHEMPSDLRAFYAGGQVVMQHQDPYQVQPLFTLEQQLAGPRNPLLYVTPTPLPSYDLLAFAALAHFPVKVATVIYGFIIVGAIFLIAHCLSRMSVLPLPVAFAATFFGIGYSAITFGQMLPIIGAGLAYGALLLRQRKEQAAAIAICTALIQPQIAVFVLISCFCFVPKMRITLSVILMGFFAILLSLGLPLLREYLQVISLQARSEVMFPGQYSLTWLAHYLGLSINSSLLVGCISTLFCLGLSLGIVARWRKAAVKNGAIILLPAAFALCGGTYMHAHHIALALITAIALSSSKPSWQKALPAAILVMMYFDTAQPLRHWPSNMTLFPVCFSIVTAWALVYYLLVNASQAKRIQQASLITVGLSGYFFGLIAFRPPLNELMGATIAPMHLPTMFASGEWLRVNSVRYATTNYLPFFFFFKVPTWTALILILINGARSLSPDNEPQLPTARTKHIPTQTGTILATSPLQSTSETVEAKTIQG